jgi:hypothetical protein
MLKNIVLKATIAAGLICSTAGLASAAPLVLPEFAPIPMARSAALAELQEASIPHREVVQIATVAQAIPEERLEVRVVGTRFLPPVDESLALNAPGSQATGLVSSIEAASVWVLKTASAGMFSEAVAAPDQTIASLESE